MIPYKLSIKWPDSHAIGFHNVALEFDVFRFRFYKKKGSVNEEEDQMTRSPGRNQKENKKEKHQNKLKNHRGKRKQLDVASKKIPNGLSRDVPLTSESLFYRPDKEETQESNVGCF